MAYNVTLMLCGEANQSNLPCDAEKNYSNTFIVSYINICMWTAFKF